jgi:hypothetical protein
MATSGKDKNRRPYNSTISVHVIVALQNIAMTIVHKRQLANKIRQIAQTGKITH